MSCDIFLCLIMDMSYANKLRRQLDVWHLWWGIGIGITFELATLHKSPR